MKKYLSCEIEIIALSMKDVLATSPGTYTPPTEEDETDWGTEVGGIAY